MKRTQPWTLHKRFYLKRLNNTDEISGSFHGNFVST